MTKRPFPNLLSQEQIDAQNTGRWCFDRFAEFCVVAVAVLALFSW